ncbi:hypothetical protein RhiirA5_385239, partial [Rhizophagus irregularis]
FHLYVYLLIIFNKKADHDKNIYKRKKPSFTQKYFEKSINDKGDEIRICKILDESGKRCDQEYKNVGSSTENLIVHLRDKHEIIMQDDTAVLKKILLSNFKQIYAYQLIGKARIFDLASKVPQNVGEFLDEDTVFDFEIVETRPIDFDDDEVISNIIKESISIKNLLDITALLDPHYKNLDFIEIDTKKERIIQKLRDEIGKVVVPESETLNNPAPSIDIESSIHSHKEYRQQRQSKTKKAILNMILGQLGACQKSADFSQLVAIPT